MVHAFAEGYLSSYDGQYAIPFGKLRDQFIINYPMKNFVKEDSIVRTIWGKSDTIIFIFAGAAAEFALNKAVDWLYFTGRLPSDPIGRLFSTMASGTPKRFA